MDLFTVLFYQPIFNILIVFYRLFEGNLGLAIIGIALFFRILTAPLLVRQAKMMRESKELNEKMNAIKEKYKNNKEKKEKEMLKLQSEYLPSQLAGCLPLILQFILLINVYHVISDLIHKGLLSFNQVAYQFVPTFQETESLNSSFFGIFDLIKTPSQIWGENGSVLQYLFLMILVGLSQYYSMKISFKLAEKRKVTENKKEVKNKESLSPEKDFSKALEQTNKQMLFLFPIMTAFLSYSFPAGLSIYWIAQSTFAIIQQLLLRKRLDREFTLSKNT